MNYNFNFRLDKLKMINISTQEKAFKGELMTETRFNTEPL
jgi:hypothetical protein